jgi:superfamily II DNA/RNA helicase
MNIEAIPTQESDRVASVRPDAPTFAELGARPETVAALEQVGITHAFAIQEYAVPIAMRGVDLIGQAPTGTGKTLGFGVPLLERLLAPGDSIESTEEASDPADGSAQALVVVPTRELGLQVARDLAAAGRTRGVRVLPVYGGVAYEPQVEALQRGVEVIVGTPGRLLDLAKPARKGAKPLLRLDRIRTLVLDEADRMLDLGFLEDVEKILAMLPEERQTMLFSATMPDPIVTLARRFLNQPVTIHANHASELPGLSPQTVQVAYRTHSLNKVEVVARILQAKERGLTMIFTRTKRAADRVSEDLDFRGFAVAAVHGDLGQGARERALRAFRAGKIDVLVATDVAARGLDVTGVTHVINYDCPEDAEAYVHRIGRTGRAGATGVAVTFVDWEDVPRWHLIDKTLGLELPDPPETYHTSAHLFADLSIPEGVPGTLPTASRTRVGLGAEVEEDLGGRKPRGRDGATDRPARSGRSRPGESRSGESRSGESRSSGSRSGGSRSGDSTRGESARGESRGRGGRDAADPIADGTGPVAEVEVGKARQPRRRRRGGQALGIDGAETSTITVASSAVPAETGDAESPAGSGEAAGRRRRRRGGRGRRPAQTTES